MEKKLSCGNSSEEFSSTENINKHELCRICFHSHSGSCRFKENGAFFLLRDRLETIGVHVAVRRLRCWNPREASVLDVIVVQIFPFYRFNGGGGGGGNGLVGIDASLCFGGTPTMATTSMILTARRLTAK